MRNWMKKKKKQPKLNNAIENKNLKYKILLSCFLSNQTAANSKPTHQFIHQYRKKKKGFPTLSLPIPRSGWIMAIFSLEPPFFSIVRCLTQTTAFFPVNKGSSRLKTLKAKPNVFYSKLLPVFRNKKHVW